MQGISTPLLIVITLIVILITALVILTIFSGGTQDIASVINSWLHGPGKLPPACATGCNAWKATCKPGESIPYRSFPGCDLDGDCVCPQVQK